MKIKSILVASLALGAGIFVIKKQAFNLISHAVHAQVDALTIPQKFVFLYDYRFSETFKHEFESFIAHYYTTRESGEQRYLSPEELEKLVFERFSCVKKLAVTKNYKIKNCEQQQGEKCLSWHIQVIPVMPQVLCNSNLLWACTTMLVSREYFKDQVVCDLPALTIAPPEFADSHAGNIHVSQECVGYLKNFNKQEHAWCSCTWMNNQKIELQDKKHERITVLTDAHTGFDFSHDAYQNIQKIVLEQEQKQARKKNKLAHWVVDVRFKNQMIVFQKGEKG